MAGYTSAIRLLIISTVIPVGISQHRQSNTSTECDVFWSNRETIGFQKGVQLQACCNVSSVQIWSLTSPSELLFEEEFSKLEENEVWDDLQLSICSDRSEPTIGWVGERPGVSCEYRIGQKLDIPYEAVNFKQWYIICYIMQNGCKTCKLDVLCGIDMTESCLDVLVDGSSPRATNSSIDYWIQPGREYPFADSSHIELTVSHQWSNDLVTTRNVSVKAGHKISFSLEDLRPRVVYNIQRCIVIRIPQEFRDDPRFRFGRDAGRLCVTEGYRTKPNSASSLNVSLLSILFYFTCSLL